MVKLQGHEFDPSSPVIEVPLHAVVAWSNTAFPFAFTTDWLTVTSFHILAIFSPHSTFSEAASFNPLALEMDI